jgi:hypothetical protein
LIKGINEEFKHFITFEYYSQDHLTRKGHLIGGKANKLLHQRNRDGGQDVLDYHNELDYHNNLHCTLQTYHDADVFCSDLFHDLFRESYHHHVVICVSLM